jgi:hypothetical protein
MIFRASSISCASRKANKFIRSGECFLRVHNFPLAYKTKFKRPFAEEALWHEMLARKEKNKRTNGLLKRENNPTWYRSS